MIRWRLVRLAGPAGAAVVIELLFMLRTITDKGLWDNWTGAYEKVISGYLFLVFPLTLLVVMAVEIVRQGVDKVWPRRGFALEIASYWMIYTVAGLAWMTLQGVPFTPPELATAIAVFAASLYPFGGAWPAKRTRAVRQPRAPDPVVTLHGV